MERPEQVSAAGARGTELAVDAARTYYHAVSATNPTQSSLLLVMRHAETAPAPPGRSDFERPLTPRGAAEAVAMGRWLHSVCPELALIACSPAQRARETAHGLLTAFPERAPQIEWERTLYLAEPTVLVGLIAAYAPRPLLLIGHNPGLAEFVQWMTGADAQMPTAALIGLALAPDDGVLRPGAARIQIQMRPAQLRQ